MNYFAPAKVLLFPRICKFCCNNRAISPPKIFILLFNLAICALFLCFWGEKFANINNFSYLCGKKQKTKTYL